MIWSRRKIGTARLVILLLLNAAGCGPQNFGNAAAIRRHHPVITFDAPADGAVIHQSHGGRVRVFLAATIEHLEEGSIVLVHLDGQRAEDITSLCDPPKCQIEVSDRPFIMRKR